MKALFDTVSYACSVKVTKAYSTSFSSAVKMLAPSIRQDIYNIYGFVRFADEIVDSFHDYNKEELFYKFEIELDDAIKNKISLNPILNSFQHTVNRHNIKRELIDTFMKSMKLDLVKQEYKTTEEYNEYIFKFNNAGYIDRKIWFNRLGQFHSVYEYTRDANNKITKVVFHYLDSLGNIPKDFDMPQTTDYSYTNGYLSKTKERDNDQKVQPDEKSIYQTFEYDSKGRQIKNYSYRYYDFTKPSSYTTNIKYNDTTKTITSKT